VPSLAFGNDFFNDNVFAKGLNLSAEEE